MTTGGTPEEILATPAHPAHLLQIERVLEKFVSYQFDLPPHRRRNPPRRLIFPMIGTGEAGFQIFSKVWKYSVHILRQGVYCVHMNADSRKLSILMPAYNEGSRIYDNLMHVVAVLNEHPLDYELIVIDDGSLDQTAEEIQRAATKYPHLIKPVLLEKNQGKGAALCAGFYHADGELIAFLDSDMDLPPAQIVLLLELMDLSGADIIVGSKRHPDSMVAYPFHRKLMSEVYYQFVRLLLKLPVRDTQVGIKLFRRPVLEYAVPRLTTERFAFDVELLSLAAAKGFTMKEAPVFIDYQCSWGRIGMVSILQMLGDTLKIFYRLRIRKLSAPEKPGADNPA